jgi:acetyltransferase-like isoleucine patch superfamily enzyme
MRAFKKFIQRFYYDLIKRKLNSSRRGLSRIFINARNKLVFGHYGKSVHWDPGIVFESPYNISVGDKCRIKKGVEMYCEPWGDDKDKITLKIGNGVSINEGTFINAHNYVEIGDGTLLGKRILLADTKHNFADPNLSIKDNPVTLEAPIIIGKGCGIGFNSFIFPGVTLGDHVLVSANSVITRDMPSYSVVGGNPARVLRRYDFDLGRWVKYDDKGNPKP